MTSSISLTLANDKAVGSSGRLSHRCKSFRYTGLTHQNVGAPIAASAHGIPL